MAYEVNTMVLLVLMVVTAALTASEPSAVDDLRWCDG